MRQPDVVLDNGNIRLYCGDCLEILPTLETGSVDACVTDPPYCSGGQFRSEIAKPTNEKYRGWSQDENGKAKAPSAFYSAFSGDNKDGRTFMAWSKMWLADAFAACHDGSMIVITTDWRQLPATSDVIQFAGWTWRGIVVWDKKIGRPVSGRFRNHIEYALWGSRGGFVGVEGAYPNSLVSETPPNHKDRQHVTEKTVGLFSHMMSVLPQNSTILDPFMGSGTTGVACVKTGRKFIGIELDRGYFDIAVKRIEKALKERDEQLIGASHATA